jgi:four helix bundle protein
MHCQTREQQIILPGNSCDAAYRPYGNHGEVEAAESRRDFVHKLKICLKELKETRRWLRLAAKSSMIPAPKMTPILNETEELIRIFFSSVQTAGQNAK